VEILGKLCFARLKLNLKTEDRFKLKTKLGFTTNIEHMKRQNADNTTTARKKPLILKNESSRGDASPGCSGAAARRRGKVFVRTKSNTPKSSAT
jgi:hypothetical protein